MNFIFNKKKCQQLMSEEKKLHHKGKTLWDDDIVKAKELQQYLILLENKIWWESRISYQQIIGLFINSKIDSQKFTQQFINLRIENRQTLMNLELSNFENEGNFIPNKKSSEFARIIEHIYNMIDLLDYNLEDSESTTYAISEGFFKRFIKSNYFSKITKYCNES